MVYHSTWRNGIQKQPLELIVKCYKTTSTAFLGQFVKRKNMSPWIENRKFSIANFPLLLVLSTSASIFTIQLYVTEVLTIHLTLADASPRPRIFRFLQVWQWWHSLWHLPCSLRFHRYACRGQHWLTGLCSCHSQQGKENTKGFTGHLCQVGNE